MFTTLKWSKFSLICFSDQQNGRKFENSWIMYNLQALLPPHELQTRLDLVICKRFYSCFKKQGNAFLLLPLPLLLLLNCLTFASTSCYKCLGIQNGFHKGTHQVCEADQSVVNYRLPYLTNPIRPMTLKALIVKLIISSVSLISNFQSNSV